MTSSSPLSSAGSWETLSSRVFSASLAATPVGKSWVPGGSITHTPAQGDRGSASLEPTAGSSDVVVLFYMAKGEGVDVCGGCIGVDNSKFCTMPCVPGGNTCGRFAKHSRKAGVNYPAFYISSPRPGVAFVQPSLLEPPGGFSQCVAKALSGPSTQEDWIRAFSAFSSIELLSESDQQDIVARFSRQVAIAPTPMRIRKKSAIEDLAQIVADNPGGEQLNVSEEDDWDVAMLLEDSDSLEKVKENWNGLVKATKQTQQDMSDIESNVRGLMEEIDDKVVKVASAIGNRKSSNAPGMTLWASIGAHSDLLESHKGDLGDIKERLDHEVVDLTEQVKEVNDVLNGKVFPVVSHLTTQIEEIQQGSSPVHNVQLSDREIKSLRDRQDFLLTELRKVEQKVASQSGATSDQALKHELDFLHQNQVKMADAIQVLRSHQIGSGRPADDDMSIVKEAIGHLQDEMSVLRLENRRLNAALNSDSFSFGGHFFHTEETYDAFITAHLPSGYYGYSLDFISLLECYEDANRTSTDGLKNTYTVAKAGYDDVQEARIDHSFGCTFPAIFGAPQDVKNPTKKMALLSSAGVWHDHSSTSGLKVDIDVFLSGFAASVESEIHAELGQGTTASLFFVALFQHTYTFWQRFAAWVDKMVLEKMSQVGTVKREAHLESVWSHICWLTHSMFIEMAKRRKAGTGNKKVGNTVDKKKKCVRVLKGTLGAHKFMKELMDHEFQKHPIFAATTDEFILKNFTTLIAHNDLVSQFKDAKETAKSAQAAADRALQAVRKGTPANPK